MLVAETAVPGDGLTVINRRPIVEDFLGELDGARITHIDMLNHPAGLTVRVASAGLPEITRAGQGFSEQWHPVKLPVTG